MKEIVLAFGCEPLLPLLSRAFAPCGVTLELVSAADCAQSLGALAGESGCKRTAEACEGAFPEPMLVFCGFEGARADVALGALKAAGLKLPYKAMLTKTNKKWKPGKLLAELKREHAMMAGLK